MTGRDLILYILKNGLENEPVFKDGKFVGFVTPIDVAKEANVGTATVLTWISLGKIESERIAEGIYIPANFELPDRVV